MFVRPKSPPDRALPSRSADKSEKIPSARLPRYCCRRQKRLNGCWSCPDLTQECMAFYLYIRQCRYVVAETETRSCRYPNCILSKMQSTEKAKSFLAFHMRMT